MIDLTTLTIKKAHTALLRGEYTVRELVNAYLKKIEEKNNELNVYHHLFTDIDDRVEIAQKMFTDGSATLLTGIPIALKSIITKKGQVTNASSKILENYKATYSATAVNKLEEQGVIFLGSVNADEFAMGASTENSAFGVTKNPVDTTRVAGGSSGGSITAVAADMALVALGTDTGGSVREPAAFCGVVGFKSTYGAVSRYGSYPMGSSFDQICPTAKKAEDAEIVEQTIRGADEYDMTCINNSTWQKTVTKEQYTIAVPKTLVDGSSDEVKEVFNTFIEALKKAGHTIEEIEMPMLDIVLAIYYILIPAEVSSNTARYDGMRYGLKVEGSDLWDEYKKTRGQGFGDEVKRRIMLGTYVLSAGYADKYYEKALALREQLKNELKKTFTEYDFIATPTAPVVAPKIGEMSGDPLAEYLMDIFTVTANTAGIPAISIPAGNTPEGLPVGAQLMAAWEQDDALFDIAKRLGK
ncbi:MAG: Asp-tRNA(Asn)/Glu-tRNA(Gln) amidotransferase subunit GatA [Candidatus Pacebacteria bacterium]|nr:Asp-tRNA(Asn)/Glu-tRNA(Gln) amidotransferase subunit GatA [Candidatus Paceibacterota bacterium]